MWGECGRYGVMVGGRGNVKGCIWLLTHPCSKARVGVGTGVPYQSDSIIIQKMDFHLAQFWF